METGGRGKIEEVDRDRRGKVGGDRRERKDRGGGHGQEGEGRWRRWVGTGGRGKSNELGGSGRGWKDEGRIEGETHLVVSIIFLIIIKARRILNHCLPTRPKPVRQELVSLQPHRIIDSYCKH